VVLAEYRVDILPGSTDSSNAISWTLPQMRRTMMTSLPQQSSTFPAVITFTNISLEFAGDRWHSKDSTNFSPYAAVQHHNTAHRRPLVSITRNGEGGRDDYFASESCC
jgi:hypothetical protein